MCHQEISCVTRTSVSLMCPTCNMNDSGNWITDSFTDNFLGTISLQVYPNPINYVPAWQVGSLCGDLAKDFFVEPELLSSIYSMRVYYEATSRGSPSGKYCSCLFFKRQMTMWKPTGKVYIMPCQCQQYESRAWEIAYLTKYEISRIRAWFGIPTST